jgi:hypothetical protein
MTVLRLGQKKATYVEEGHEYLDPKGFPDIFNELECTISVNTDAKSISVNEEGWLYLHYDIPTSYNYTIKCWDSDHSKAFGCMKYVGEPKLLIL